MATSEIVINEYLSTELRSKYAKWQKAGAVICESTEALTQKSKRPDLIVIDNPMAPVGIETEFFPAASVEEDARSRLGKVYAPTGGKIYSVVGVRLPAKYRQLAGKKIAAALKIEDDLQYCLLTGDSAQGHLRWPQAGYVSGSVTDLAHVIATATISPVAVAEGVIVMENGARVLAAMLGSAADVNPSFATEISEDLRQEAGPQTYAMAAVILINAFVFQETIAGTSGALTHIRSIYSYGSGSGHPTKKEVIDEWAKILSINYWSIFGIARALITALPTHLWKEFSRSAVATADKLVSLNLGKNPDLIGTIFQRLISDRRFLATFYTAPQSAALLARLVIGPTMANGSEWSQIDGLKKLTFADFACGTGSLLTALYSEVRNQMETAGVNAQSLHKWMVENAIVGSDVIPSATYITASQLSSVYPTVQYTSMKILTMPFGRLDDGGIALGALDLLDTQGAMSTIATSAGGVGAHSKTEVDAWKALGGTAVDDESFDFVAMNPPFTRLTGGGGKSSSVSRPLFAAFGTTAADQKDMAKKAHKLFGSTVYHGNAGAGSAFVEIAHKKLRKGGSLGLILPLVALSGSSWEACRALWRKHYRALVVLSIASNEAESSAFSADTGVAECMIVGKKSKTLSERLVSVTLYRRPTSTLEGGEVARRLKLLIESNGIRGIEEGPLGGTALSIGDEKIGEAVTAPIDAGPWSLSRIYDHAVAQVAYQLMREQRIWLPGETKAHLEGVPFCRLADLGFAGPYHLDISGSATSGGAPRGPFKLVATSKPMSVSFPALAAHDERRERSIEIQADAEAIPRTGKSPDENSVLANRRTAIWDTRTKLHFATDVRFNANALIACVTTRDALGGRAWPSFILKERRFEKAITLWFNSTLGILTFWWLSSKSQDGRGSVTTSRLLELGCFDPRSLSESDLHEVDVFFEKFRLKPLLDIHECTLDPNRAELDHFIVRTFLKAGPIAPKIDDGLRTLSAKLALEPTINGSRSSSDEPANEDEEEAEA